MSGESRDVYIMGSLVSSTNHEAHIEVLCMMGLLMHQDTLGHILHLFHDIRCLSHLLYAREYLCIYTYFNVYMLMIRRFIFIETVIKQFVPMVNQHVVYTFDQHWNGVGPSECCSVYCVRVFIRV